MPKPTHPRRPQPLVYEREHALAARNRARAAPIFTADPWDPLACWEFYRILRARLRRRRQKPLPPNTATCIFLTASGITSLLELSGHMECTWQNVKNRLYLARKAFGVPTTERLVVLLWNDYERARRRAEQGRYMIRQDDRRRDYPKDDHGKFIARRMAQPDPADRVGRSIEPDREPEKLAGASG